VTDEPHGDRIVGLSASTITGRSIRIPL
jgi:hypothetical protein